MVAGILESPRLSTVEPDKIIGLHLLMDPVTMLLLIILK
jgi:hypothetical protein